MIITNKQQVALVYYIENLRLALLYSKIGFNYILINDRLLDVVTRYSPAYGDLNGAARRKNVTRDSTTTLKAWLNEHRKNPYPTKGEKIMLAIITKMTLTQVKMNFFENYFLVD